MSAPLWPPCLPRVAPAAGRAAPSHGLPTCLCACSARLLAQEQFIEYLGARGAAEFDSSAFEAPMAMPREGPLGADLACAPSPPASPCLCYHRYTARADMY